MLQFLNNIWSALSTENLSLLNFLLMPVTFIENYLSMSLFLIILNVKSTMSQKSLYVISISLISILSSYIVPSPFNVFLNYVSIILLIKLFFKLSLFKSFISLLISIFIFGLLNVLLQNPYLTILGISPNTFITTPIYRITYLIILYLLLSMLCFLLKKFQTLRFTLDLIDTLDKKTKILLLLNLIVGFLTLCIQLIITAFYIDIVPVIITMLSFILLISFLV
jgi:hypothetical protein